MVDTSASPNRPADMVCPWCSAAITAETAVCPSCGAILNADEPVEVPGVTAVDAQATRGPATKPAPPARSRIMSWISGDYPDDGTAPADSQALAPPDLEVQREMLRLELEAEVANLQAENDALLSEAAMEGRVIDIPDSIKPLLTGEALTEVENAIDENTAEEAAAEGDARDDADAATDGDDAATEADDTPATEDDAPATEDETPA
jgi:hypothetical protein